MLSRACRFLSTATLGVSIAAAGMVTLFSALILVGAMMQPCVDSYRQANPNLDLIFDSIGLPLFSCGLALMSRKISTICNDAIIDGPFNWVSLNDARMLATGLLCVAGANLAIAVLACNRYAAVWSHCQAAMLRHAS